MAKEKENNHMWSWSFGNKFPVKLHKSSLKYAEDSLEAFTNVISPSFIHKTMRGTFLRLSQWIFKMSGHDGKNGNKFLSMPMAR